MNRRIFISGVAAFLAAPAIVRASSLMAIKPAEAVNAWSAIADLTTLAPDLTVLNLAVNGYTEIQMSRRWREAIANAKVGFPSMEFLLIGDSMVMGR